MHTSAKAFMTEGKVATDPVDTKPMRSACMFNLARLLVSSASLILLMLLVDFSWNVGPSYGDIFIARTTEKHSEAVAIYIEVFTISVIFVKDGVPGRPYHVGPEQEQELPRLGKDYQRIAKAQKLVLQHWLEASSNFHLRTNSSEIEKERLETEDADLYHIPERTVRL
ncbi:hypothetical protein L6452_18308 [Arctium lappa]|uniref:Uncharacterized protein n=1 Tax=Arctium lappa TaxID=4217 RepID=A0ACB9C5Q1_ARCLA|nr:hypothetical protein L6452_18308 [Arctium lappa]